jgi:hypothetical protein
VAPTDRDLQAFSEVLKIPLETPFALRIMDSIPDRRMLALTGTGSYMIPRTKQLLLAGFTLRLGMVSFARIRLDRSIESLFS